jgi:hypothetical protein
MSVHFCDDYFNHVAITQQSDAHTTCEPLPGVRTTDESPQLIARGYFCFQSFPLAVQKTERSSSLWKACNAIIPNVRIIGLSLFNGDLFP